MSTNTSRMSLGAKRSRIGIAVLAIVLGTALWPANLMAQSPPRQPVDTGVRNTLPSRPMGTVHDASHAATHSAPPAKVATPPKVKAAAPAEKSTPAAAKPKPAPAATKPAPKKMPGMPGMDHSKMPGMGKPTGKP